MKFGDKFDNKEYRTEFDEQGIKNNWQLRTKNAV